MAPSLGRRVGAREKAAQELGTRVTPSRRKETEAGVPGKAAPEVGNRVTPSPLGETGDQRKAAPGTRVIPTPGQETESRGRVDPQPGTRSIHSGRSVGLGLIMRPYPGSVVVAVLGPPATHFSGKDGGPLLEAVLRLPVNPSPRQEAMQGPPLIPSLEREPGSPGMGAGPPKVGVQGHPLILCLGREAGPPV